MNDFSATKHTSYTTQERNKIPEVPEIMEEASKFENFVYNFVWLAVLLGVWLGVWLA